MYSNERPRKASHQTHEVTRKGTAPAGIVLRKKKVNSARHPEDKKANSAKPRDDDTVIDTSIDRKESNKGL